MCEIEKIDGEKEEEARENKNKNGHIDNRGQKPELCNVNNLRIIFPLMPSENVEKEEE